VSNLSELLRFVSYSKIATYKECPFKFYLAYVLQEKPLYKPAYTLGQEVHKIIAEYYRTLPDAVTPREVSMYVTQTAKKLGLDAYLNTSLLQNFIAFEEDRLRWHVNPKPMAIEKHYVKEPFEGIVDALFMSKRGVVVVDWKTSLYKGVVGWEKMRLQANIYMYLTGARKALFYGLVQGRAEEFEYDEEYLMEQLRVFKKNVLANRFERNMGEYCYNCEYNIQCFANLWGFEVLEL
jgi:CRISPR/Cas system-associated exonuclease Cas4 (RecB family)